MTSPRSTFFDQPTYLAMNAEVTIALRARIVREMLGDCVGLRILDVGCGDGALTVQFAETASMLTLLDLSRVMLDRAAVRIGARPNVEFHRGDILAFTSSAPYDVALCVGVLAHVDAVAAVIQRIAQCVRSGGRVLIQCTDRDRWFGRALFAFERHWGRVAYGYAPRATTRSEVCALAEASGLKFLSEQSYAGLIPGMGRLPRTVRYWFQAAPFSHRAFASFGSEALLLFERV